MSYPSTGPNGMPTPPSSVPSTNQGSPISVGGVVYGWSDALGRYVPSTPLEWDTYELLVAAWPTALVGQKMLVKRILGSGHYQVQWNGSRWAVGMAEAPVRLQGDVALTATGTAYVQLASSVIGHLIGDNETWLFRATARNAGVYTASGSLVVRSSGSVANIGSAALMSAASARCRRIGCVRRAGGTLQRVAGAGENWSSVGASDQAIADWSTLSIETGIIPGASGDTFVLEEFVLIREA